MDNKNLAKFVAKVSEIFDLLEVREGKDEAVKNLISSFFIIFSRLLATDEKISRAVTGFSQNPKNNDPSKLFDFLDSQNFEYKTHIDLAQKETLESFVKEMGSNLSSEKVEGLKRIISE